ncbi:hypothetical protein D0Z07_3566 [Hyphodiscus hymeniophilus]|uniref:DUF7820 domain-containing protein n=1 Tax=Hyphodiscus hymeniophilus TaxID=353542 RepID=A0A9P6VL20_9HELO|nr:hypothetical protein D0Z07_3566 [Hyphodiscus hymeniophilus]
MDRRSTGIDRRASARHSMANDGSDDEDYDSAAMGISNGFRPSDITHNRTSSQTSPNHGRRTSNCHPYRDLQSVPIPPPRPSSISKPNYDSFALRHDGATGPIAARHANVASSSNSVPSRSSSVSTDIPFRAESPYQGPSGPSHPYQMYPQESRLARTASIATTSTVPVQERSYIGPSAPGFPYGMYPQNTVPELESLHDEQAATPIPAGFPGLNNNYQRRLGPDGEEIADIIGPDGHTEQLPPYSQYPEGRFARKACPVAQPLVAVGAGGIGLATRDPEFASREDVNSSDSRLSSRSLTVVDSGPQTNNDTPGISEKPTLKPWQRFAKRKVCGIVPAWALVLAASVLVIFCIVLGSVLAVLKSQHSHRHHNVGEVESGQSVVYTTTILTTTFDATPLSTTPTGVSALPTGVYGLPISSPATQQSGCLQNTAQSAAWSCQIALALPYQLNVTSIPGESPLSDNEITLNYGNNTMNFLSYGAQPPLLSKHQVMGLVVDSQSPERGPAWFFQAAYNKVVVLPDLALQAPSNGKRQDEPRSSPSSYYMERKGTAQPGQNPWICYWNGTFLETFIYVNQTSSWGARSSSSSSSSYTTSVSSATYSQSAQPSVWSDSLLTPYPKVIKVQERRVPSGYEAIPPYCIQHEVNSDGSVIPLLNSTGQPITVYLNETEPSSVSPISDRSNLFERLEERDRHFRERDVTQSCGCVWIST